MTDTLEDATERLCIRMQHVMIDRFAAMRFMGLDEHDCIKATTAALLTIMARHLTAAGMIADDITEALQHACDALTEDADGSSTPPSES